MAILCLVGSSAFAATIAKVTNCSGSIFFRDRNNVPYQKLDKGKSLAEGGWVKTGANGWIELTLIDNSRFTIANNSELELASLHVDRNKKEGVFNLTQGKLRSSVTKLSGQQTSYQVRSKTAVAGIKGTEFLMLSEGPANVFFGNEGTVKVSGQQEGSEPLPPGSMTQTTRGYRPIESVQVEPGTPIAEAKSAFEAATAAAPPEDWLASDNLPNILARWNVNYGHYLADSGKYEQALQVFQIALDLSKLADIRCDARLERGAVQGRFLSNPEAALAEYELIIEEYPSAPQAETALFYIGQVLYELSFKERATARFKEYRSKYPQGKHRGNVDTLLNLLDK
ncbi:FecR domain-containing protein [Geomonas sp. Red875]|uniref:FecR domain-containing protein n=2 Tax=Geomesophilobacter sediminis TaxID=2798584 RepID=A0A8J7M172_9BACT|nr:FecR domain-containing protein [Geomesophilobacter sediminis]